MTRELLVRGMLVGVVAGLLSFGFLKTFGEPQVDRAIAFESRMEEQKSQARMQAEMAEGVTALQEAPEPERVSRQVQSGIGLFTAVTVYSAAFGGLFSLAFAFAYGRAGELGARTTSALLALAGIVSVYIVPSLKYAASPPAVGEPETIGIRTVLYFVMILVSVAATIASVVLRHRLVARYGTWNATIMAGAAYLAVVVVVAAAMPTVDEVPELFPAVVLWKFRVASMGAQLVMWTTLGLGFGALAERAMTRRRRWPLGAANGLVR